MIQRYEKRTVVRTLRILLTPPRTSIVNGIEYTRLPVANYTPSWGRQPDPKSRCWNNQLVTSTVKNNISVTITNNYTGGLTESSFKQGGWEIATDVPLSCDDTVTISANRQPGPTTYGIAPDFEFELGNITEMPKVCDVALPGGLRPPIGDGGFVPIASSDININLKKEFQKATISATNLVNFLNSNSTTTQYNGADFTMSLEENKIDKWWRWTENCAVINISKGLKAVSLSKKYSQWLQLTTNNNGPDLPANPEMDTVYVSYSTTTNLRSCTVKLSSPLPFNWQMAFEETRPTTSYPMYPIKTFAVTLSAGSTEMTVYPQTSGYTTVSPALKLASYLSQYKCDNKRWIIYESKSSSANPPSVTLYENAYLHLTSINNDFAIRNNIGVAISTSQTFVDYLIRMDSTTKFDFDISTGNLGQTITCTGDMLTGITMNNTNNTAGMGTWKISTIRSPKTLTVGSTIYRIFPGNNTVDVNFNDTRPGIIM